MIEQTTGTSVSTSFWNCKYHLPCGYCELKKTECNWWQTVTMPCKDDWFKITPTWKMNEVTCNNERTD